MDDWVWADLEYIVENKFEENQTLECKRGLPVRNGNDPRGPSSHPWQQGRHEVGEYTRDELAKEIVAFANAYGGLLIVGIEESTGKIRHAKSFGELLLRSGEFADRFQRSLSIIDPPLNNIEIKALTKPEASNGEGVLLVRVGNSTMEPHGFGSPPKAYIRRGEEASPMTMRELHNYFWEARTMRERVLQIQAERREAFRLLIEKKRSGRLFEYNKPIDASAPALAFRCTVIPESNIQLMGVVETFIRGSTQLPRLLARKSEKLDTIARFVQSIGQWFPRAHGIYAQGRGGSTITVLDSGLVEIMGFSLDSFGRDSNRHYPGWFSADVATMMVVAERLKLAANLSSVPLVIDCEFWCDGSVASMSDREQAQYVPFENISLGPFVVDNWSRANLIFAEIERQVWHGLAQVNVEHVPIDFEAMLEQFQLNLVKFDQAFL